MLRTKRESACSPRDDSDPMYHRSIFGLRPPLKEATGSWMCGRGTVWYRLVGVESAGYDTGNFTNNAVAAVAYVTAELNLTATFTPFVQVVAPDTSIVSGAFGRRNKYGRPLYINCTYWSHRHSIMYSAMQDTWTQHHHIITCLCDCAAILAMRTQCWSPESACGDCMRQAPGLSGRSSTPTTRMRR